MKRFTFALNDAGAKGLTVEDIRRQALKRLPRMLGAYVESMAEDGETGARNRAAFQEQRLLPRALAGVSDPQLSTNIAGDALASPILLAPTGLAGMLHHHGEAGLARAARAAGTRMILSTASTASIEAVGTAAGTGHWYQLYPIGDHDRVLSIMQRALGAGFATLVVTVDTATVGKREAEARNGLGMPVRLTPARCLDLLRHPRWLAGYLRHRCLYPALYSEPVLTPPARVMQTDLRWEDIAWIKENWPGRIYIKGLLRAEDARIAIDEIGASGVILSNHGGRQLGSTIAALDVVSQVRRVVGERGEILLDGGIRRGADIAKALCLGADAVLIGRPALYGLAVGGEAGVRRVIDILADELRIALILLGCPTVRALSCDYLAASNSAPCKKDRP